MDREGNLTAQTWTESAQIHDICHIALQPASLTAVCVDASPTSTLVARLMLHSENHQQRVLGKERHERPIS